MLDKVFRSEQAKKWKVLGKIHIYLQSEKENKESKEKYQVKDEYKESKEEKYLGEEQTFK